MITMTYLFKRILLSGEAQRLGIVLPDGDGTRGKVVWDGFFFDNHVGELILTSSKLRHPSIPHRAFPLGWISAGRIGRSDTLSVKFDWELTMPLTLTP